MDQRRALLSPVLDQQPALPSTPALTVHVEIHFTDPVIRSRYTRSYGSSPDFQPTPRIRKGLLRRIERCSEELITRKDSGALDILKDGTYERKPLRYEIAFRVITRERGEYAQRTYRSYQKQPLTVGLTKDIILASHRIVGLFLRRHDEGFKWFDGAVRDSSLEGPQLTSPSLDGPLSLLCVPGLPFIESTQQFEHVPGYSIELSFRSRNPRRRVPVFGKTLRISSEQTAPLTSDMCEDLLWKGLNAINCGLEPRKQQFDLHSRSCWESDCRHSNDEALNVEIRVVNKLGSDWNAHRNIQSKLLLFRDPEAHDCNDFLQAVEAKLVSIRNESDAKINDLDDFEFRVVELRGSGWSVRHPAGFSRGSSSSYGRRTIQAALDRIQTGIADVLRGHDVAIRVSARKRGHVILDKAIVARAKRGTPGEMFASPQDAQEIFVSRLRARIQQDLDKVFADTCSIDDLPEEEEQEPERPSSAVTMVEVEPPSPQKRPPSEPPSIPTTPVKSPRLQRMFSLTGRSPSVKSVGSIGDFRASGDPFESYGSKTVSVASEDVSETASAIGEERPPLVYYSPIKPTQRRFPLISPRRNTSSTGRVSNASTLIGEIPVDLNPTHEDAIRAVDLDKDVYDGNAPGALHFMTSGASKSDGAHADARVVPALTSKASVVDRRIPIEEPQPICTRDMDSPPDAVFVDAAEFAAAAVPSPGVADLLEVYSTAPSTPGLSMGESPRNSEFTTTPLRPKFPGSRAPAIAVVGKHDLDDDMIAEGSSVGGVTMKVAAKIDAATSGGSTAGKEKYDIDTTTATSPLSPAPEIMAALIETESPALLWGVLRSAEPTAVELNAAEPEISEPKVAEVEPADPAPTPTTTKTRDTAGPQTAESVAMVSDVDVSGAPATLWGLLKNTEEFVAAAEVQVAELDVQKPQVAEVQPRGISKPEPESIAQPVEAHEGKETSEPAAVEPAPESIAKPIAVSHIETRQPPAADLTSGSPTNLWGLLQQPEAKVPETETQERSFAEVAAEPALAPQAVVSAPEPVVGVAREIEPVAEAEPEKSVEDNKADEPEVASLQNEETPRADAGAVEETEAAPEPAVAEPAPVESEVKKAEKSIAAEPVAEDVTTSELAVEAEPEVEEAVKEEIAEKPEVIETEKEPEQPEIPKIPANKTEDAPVAEVVADDTPKEAVTTSPEASETEVPETPVVSEAAAEEAQDVPVAKELVEEAPKGEVTVPAGSQVETVPEQPETHKAEVITEEATPATDVAESVDTTKDKVEIVTEEPKAAETADVAEQPKELEEKTETEPVVETRELSLEAATPSAPEVQTPEATVGPKVVQQEAKDVVSEATTDKAEAETAVEPVVEVAPVDETTTEAPAAESPDVEAAVIEVPVVEATSVVETPSKSLPKEEEGEVIASPEPEVTKTETAEQTNDKPVNVPAVDEAPTKEVENAVIVVDEVDEREVEAVVAGTHEPVPSPAAEPVEEAAPAQEVIPAVEEALTREAVAVEEAAPVEETTPIEEVKEVALVQEVAPVVEAAPAQEVAPALEAAPAVEAVPGAFPVEAPVEAPAQEKEAPASVAVKAIEPVEVGQDAMQKEDTIVADAEATEKAVQQDAPELVNTAETVERGETLVDHDVREVVANSPESQQQLSRATETIIEVSAPTTADEVPEQQATTAPRPSLISADSGSSLENITPNLTSTKSLRPDIAVQDFAPPTAKPLLSPISNPHYLTPSPRTSTSSWTSLDTRGSVDTLRSKDEPAAIAEEPKTTPPTAGLLGLHPEHHTLDLGLRGALGKHSVPVAEGKRPAAEETATPVKRRKVEEIEEQ
ncbi:hypothetical protein OQA88_3665, partial [Cercophora sp. LCS_1]